ncbi:hypothetical protein VPH46_00925 [Sphingomonas sp. MJ1 (PH-R8)]|uniref:hypothetical protein n=1 Tax=Sphingomonas sp. MJ1 (PH-R8) TaxID=3112950 RepID=UPI003A8C35AA
MTILAVKLPTLPIHRRDGDRHDDRLQKQEEVTGIAASWHDRGAAKMKTVAVGMADCDRKLSRTHANEADARRPRAPSEIAAMLSWTVSTLPVRSISIKR